MKTLKNLLSCQLTIDSSSRGLRLSVLRVVTLVVFKHLTLCALLWPDFILHLVLHLKPMKGLMNIVKSFKIVDIVSIPFGAVTGISNTTWNCDPSVICDRDRTTYCSAFQKACLVKNCSWSPALTTSGVSPSIHFPIKGSTGPSVLSIQRPQPQ